MGYIKGDDKMFKTLHMVITIIRTKQIAEMLLKDYNINIMNANDMRATELVFNIVMARTLSNRQIAKEVFETIEISNKLFTKVEAA